jgi:hypothetical protein
LSAGAWAQREFVEVQLGDRRLSRRATQVAEAMALDPSGSIPKQNKSWKQIKGAYRLFDQATATFESMSQPHWQHARRAAGECKRVVLLEQDTSWLDYSAHAQKTSGLGWYGKSERQPPGGGGGGGSGLFLHSVLAVEPQGQRQARIIGLMHAKLWARHHDPVGAGSPARSRRRRSDDRESLRWSQAVLEIGGPPPDSTARWLHVGDRESDIFELYDQTRQLAGVGFVVRIKHDRNATVGHDTPDTCSLKDRKSSSVKDLLRALAPLGQSKLWVPPRQGKRGGQRGRWATLNVSASALTIWSPQLNGRRGQALRCWGVRVWEIDAPADVEEPLEWLVLTSEPVSDVEDALRIAEYYSHRWLIEEYHKCLKSGCRVEERQLERVERLEPLIGMLCVLAVRLLQLKNDTRLMPQAPAIKHVPRESVKTLARMLNVAPDSIALRQFTHEVAKLGGFIGRRSDGEPGWLTLWRGWHELDLITTGVLLAERGERCG